MADAPAAQVRDTSYALIATCAARGIKTNIAPRLEERVLP